MTGLTERHKEILQLMAEGMSNAAIGAKLHISEDTVKTHVRRMFKVLGARDRANAVYLAFCAGVVGAPPSNPELRARIQRADAVLTALHEARQQAPADSRYARLYDAVKTALSGPPERT